MPRALQMIPEQKQIINNMKNHGEPDRIVNKYVGCNQSTGSRVYERWREEHTVAVQQRSGRPRKADERMDRVIWRLSKRTDLKLPPSSDLSCSNNMLFSVFQNRQA